MKKVILRWLFKNSPHFVDVNTTESEAKSLIKRWSDMQGQGFLNGYDFQDDRNWQIDVSEISAAITLSIDKLQEEHEKKIRLQQQSQQPQNKTELVQFPPNKWGRS